MKLKNRLVFETEKNGNMYEFHFPSGAPLGEAYTACTEFLDEVIRYINEHQLKRQEKEKGNAVEEGQEPKDD